MATTASDAPDPGRRFLTDDGEPRAFVIVSSARSGSNLLVTYLRQVARAACFGEIIRRDFPDKARWDKLVARLHMPPEARQLHREDLTAFWDLFLQQGLRRRRWLGAKAFYYHRPNDPVWSRFEASDHRVLHLWRDSTFDQYVSWLLAVESGEWIARDGIGSEPTVRFDGGDYLRYRDSLQASIEGTRARYGNTDRYVEMEYRQLTDRAFMGSLMQQLFGERVEVQERRRRQRGKPKIEYLANPSDAEPFVADSISRGFATP